MNSSAVYSIFYPHYSILVRFRVSEVCYLVLYQSNAATDLYLPLSVKYPLIVLVMWFLTLYLILLSVKIRKNLSLFMRRSVFKLLKTVAKSVKGKYVCNVFFFWLPCLTSQFLCDSIQPNQISGSFPQFLSLRSAVALPLPPLCSIRLVTVQEKTPAKLPQRLPLLGKMVLLFAQSGSGSSLGLCLIKDCFKWCHLSGVLFESLVKLFYK